MEVDFLSIKDKHIFGILNVCNKLNRRNMQIIKFWGNPQGKISIRVETTTDHAIICAMERRENLGYDFDIQLTTLSSTNHNLLEQKYIIEKLRM